MRKSKHKVSPENGVLEAFFHELTKVRDSQRSLVIITHGFVELLLNSVIDAKCEFGKTKITSNSRDYSHSVKLVLLNELGIMDDRLYDILDWFRKLRNRAAHEAFFGVTQSDLDFVNKSMNRFLSVHIEPSTGDLYHFCTLLIDSATKSARTCEGHRNKNHRKDVRDCPASHKAH